MRITRIMWDLDDDPNGNVEHIAEHGITIAEVEEVLYAAEEVVASQSSGRPITFGETSTGKYIAVVFDIVDEEVRAEFSTRPSQAQLLESGQYAGPMSIEEYLRWRMGDGHAPLTRQLQAAIAATGQSLYAIAQASGVAAPVLQRFVNGERGITLETAGRLASYLGLALLPDRRQ